MFFCVAAPSVDLGHQTLEQALNKGSPGSQRGCSRGRSVRAWFLSSLLETLSLPQTEKPAAIANRLALRGCGSLNLPLQNGSAGNELGDDEGGLLEGKSHVVHRFKTAL